ncbi:MAG: tRNA pseudouridine(38-40) synthase TruA [Dehalococcoidia bacterium]|nr:tRNA pseudouridine(38-40) synthase TruA [Dehalococcoidia bacterium]
MRLALIVEYDGTEYSGFQYQKNARTVQEEIEKAIESLTGEAVRIKAAGRTDAGVHAMGQVVAFDTEATYDPGTVMRALNARLPHDIAVRSAHRAKPGFDPRRDATSRLYRYTLLVSGTRSPLMRRYAHRIHLTPDLDSMRAAAAHMEGTNDFANFGGALEDPEASTVRRVDRIDLESDGPPRQVTIDVEGSAFLPHQVRRMAGALVDVGTGRLTVSDVEKQISMAGDAPPARALPPQGLCLIRVKYEDGPF